MAQQDKGGEKIRHLLFLLNENNMATKVLCKQKKGPVIETTIPETNIFSEVL